MKLRIDPAAEEELREAARWYEVQRPGLGLELLAEADHAVQRIRQSPEQSAALETLPDHHTVRRRLLPRFPFAVIFEVVGDEIQIFAFAHTSRRPGYWRGRRSL